MAPTVHYRSRKENFVSDPSTYWLNVTNIALGAVVLVCCVVVAIGIVQELAARRRKLAAISNLDREVADLVSTYDAHAFQVPGLGLTMADGGERLSAPDRSEAKKPDGR
jgi:hypothetical protein